MKTVRSSRKQHAIRVLWCTETCALMLAVLMAARLRFHGDPLGMQSFAVGIAPRALLVALCVSGAMFTFGLYQSYVRHRRVDLLLRLALSFVLGGVALLTIYYVVPGTYIGRGVLAIALATGACAVMAIRWLVSRLSAAQMLKQRVLIYGCLLYTSRCV